MVLLCLALGDSYFLLKLCCFLIRTNQHIDHECDKSYCKDESDNVNISCEQAAQLIDDERYCISEYALITNCEQCPLCVVHLSLHSTDSCEARCAEEIECEE